MSPLVINDAIHYILAFIICNTSLWLKPERCIDADLVISNFMIYLKFMSDISIFIKSTFNLTSDITVSQKGNIFKTMSEIQSMNKRTN